MNTTEELDDFELSIRSKLADFEVTPPEGSWNAIAQNAGTEHRKMRIVWFNKSSFFTIFFASMFSMWLAFGSISFELNKYEEESLILINDIRQSRGLMYENISDENADTLKDESNKNDDSKISVKNTNKINKSFISNLNELIINPELEIAQGIKTNEINREFTSQLPPVKLLTSYSEKSIFPFLPKPRLNIYANVQHGLVYSNTLLNGVNNDALKNGNIFIHQNFIGLDVSYDLSNNIQIFTGLRYHRLYQQNNYTEEETYTISTTDTILLGYIQDPVNGKTPVYEFRDVTSTDIRNHQKDFNNILHGLEIPVAISWKFYRREKLSFAANFEGSYSSIFSDDFKYLNSEGVIATKDKESIQMFTSTSAIVVDYRFNTFLSMYFKPMYLSSNHTVLNNGAGISLGLKYKFY